MAIAAGQRNFAVSVTFNGVPIAQTAMARTGGNLTVDSTKVYPGGMADQISIGGTPTRENITVTFLYTDYIRGLHKTLDAQATTGDCPISVAEQSLGNDRARIGASRIYSGTVAAVNGPEYAADSNDAAVLEIEVATDVAMA